MNTENEPQTDYQAEIDFKMVDEWTRTVLFPKVKFLYADTDLVIGGNIFKFYKETMMDKTGCGLSPTGGYDSPRVKYQRELWTACIPRIRKNLSVKRSGVTNLMGKRFIGKICMVQTESGSRTILH
jgi:hypothetical protein